MTLHISRCILLYLLYSNSLYRLHSQNLPLDPPLAVDPLCQQVAVDETGQMRHVVEVMPSEDEACDFDQTEEYGCVFGGRAEEGEEDDVDFGAAGS